MIEQRNLARKQIRTARVLLQRLDNRLLTPLLYSAAKWFVSKGFSKATTYGRCCCPAYIVWAAPGSGSMEVA